MQPLKKLTPKKSSRSNSLWNASITYVNKQIDEINRLIPQINESDESEVKINHLKRIQAIVKQMDLELSPDLFSVINPEYQSIIREQLYQSIQKELFFEGADPLLKSDAGLTAMEYAKQNKHPALAEFLQGF